MPLPQSFHLAAVPAVLRTAQHPTLAVLPGHDERIAELDRRAEFLEL